MGALFVGSSVVVVSALCLGLALFVHRPRPQSATAPGGRARRAVTRPSTDAVPVGAATAGAATATAGAAAATRRTAGGGVAGGGVAVADPPAAVADAPAAGGRGPRVGWRERRRRNGPGPRPRIATPWWVRLRSAVLLVLLTAALAALVGTVLGLLAAAAGLVLS